MENKPQRLLIVTQVVDIQDPYLSFFHGWLIEFAKHFEHIEVVCLKEGTHSLPSNVHVHSLGKPSYAEASEGRGERMLLRLRYTAKFLVLIWRLRHSYDAVFVHMNQEYVLLGGWLWKILGKRMYLWRNHYAGGPLTDAAAWFATKVFCTSRYSYTAKYRQTVIMPLGIDTQSFSSDTSSRIPGSVLFFARFAPAKKPHLLIEALGLLQKSNVPFKASFFGATLPADAAYRAQVLRRAEELGFGNSAVFHEGVPHSAAPGIFSNHEIYINLSSSGTYDKTIFEAAASGCIVLASSRDYAALAGERFLVPDDNAQAIKEKLREFLMLPDAECRAIASKTSELVLKGQNLQALAERLAAEL
ncbi:hypothetical protein A2763_02095 [Candidatus Kaiserbacteria bacterium RIFCSPHIGHO2_01_FULL_54_36]|uniref:Glycosyl transferase family 1 domain-containing protein n=1 Tax=Candidatus Kaiserbacteria bacterium RIFCSPHIGHO2_01_FULL_54_36 TaxID=1798482 RepID=A0A1F6CPT7_9BACT|nr:MAG: hypothetical protein A2763_02095 [Candidatus Kaiserbacteria bacterium RIFCSPHIGHO2_01_FULL_54_36]OGG75900.1 MAG: hypothetical protein A3A41_04565 [Candidatus Kaiserbacteria bacterium RIFCSPLOWO2_01_FULL_54_22]